MSEPMVAETPPDLVPDGYRELRAYLREIDAPHSAMEHITKVLGWCPPPFWEAPRAEADAINASIEPPEGMRHVGWICEHPFSNKPPYERITKHRKATRKNKRGWSEEKNISKSISFGDYDMDMACPQRVPVFARTVTA